MDQNWNFHSDWGMGQTKKPSGMHIKNLTNDFAGGYYMWVTSVLKFDLDMTLNRFIVVFLQGQL